MTIGLVAIGKNEEPRLARCLFSALRVTPHVVYVDSGSRDRSVAIAKEFGVGVVSLDPARPFTAARARNEGFDWLKERLPDLEFVQFMDGDCELDADWVDTAARTLNENPGVAIVCGRRRERFPDVSVYNHPLCDMEWATKVGETRACGGDSLVRADAFAEVGGFAPELPAGEEPDLCYRLRQNGFRILRIAAEMTVHDAAMTKFSQWWNRSVRSGHASAETWQRRSGVEAQDTLKEILSNFGWSLPVAWPLWPFLFWRVYRNEADLRYAAFIVLGKLPHCQGQLRFFLQHVTREPIQTVYEKAYHSAEEKSLTPEPSVANEPFGMKHFEDHDSEYEQGIRMGRGSLWRALADGVQQWNVARR